MSTLRLTFLTIFVGLITSLNNFHLYGKSVQLNIKRIDSTSYKNNLAGKECKLIGIKLKHKKYKLQGCDSENFLFSFCKISFLNDSVVINELDSNNNYKPIFKLKMNAGKSNDVFFDLHYLRFLEFYARFKISRARKNVIMIDILQGFKNESEYYNKFKKRLSLFYELVM